ncbi:MAG: 50S ribosomal protein L1 [candidate division Zixibacteria bacterium]|nr:50S ribosomal protein L1 [candidate division Zixibacteria bacterium]
MKVGKKYKEAREKIGAREPHDLDTAISKVKENAYAGFDETVEMAVRLGVNPKHADQMVRGTVALPNGTGRTVRVLAITKGEKEQEARDAGADYVGSDEYLEKLKAGWTEVDTIVATPDMMSKLGPLGKILGPRGLMPNPKAGTVTMDVGRAVKEIKAGKIEYRVDKTGNVAVPVGKVSFSEEALAQNVLAFMDAIIKAKPATAKGTYLKNVSICSTMGVGVKLSAQNLIARLKS